MGNTLTTAFNTHAIDYKVRRKLVQMNCQHLVTAIATECSASVLAKKGPERAEKVRLHIEGKLEGTDKRGDAWHLSSSSPPNAPLTQGTHPPTSPTGLEYAALLASKDAPEDRLRWRAEWKFGCDGDLVWLLNALVAYAGKLQDEADEEETQMKVTIQTMREEVSFMAKIMSTLEEAHEKEDEAKAE